MRRVFESVSQRPWSAAVWILIAGLFVLGAGGLGIVASCSSNSRSYPTSAAGAQLRAIRFEPNVGQTEGNFRYLAHGSGHWIYL